MYDDDEYTAVDPTKLSKTNFAIWQLGRCLHNLMVSVKYNPEELRYLHRDLTENDTVLLKELLHRFQKDMGHSERILLRECLTRLFPHH